MSLAAGERSYLKPSERAGQERLLAARGALVPFRELRADSGTAASPTLKVLIHNLRMQGYPVVVERSKRARPGGYRLQPEGLRQ